MESFKVQPLIKTPDLLGYLWGAYVAEKPGRIDTPVDCRGTAILGFIEFARRHMRENAAVGLDYLSQGMGIRLQDGTVLSWVELPDPGETLPSVGGGIPVSQPRQAAFKQSVVPSRAFPVTQPKKA